MKELANAPIPAATPVISRRPTGPHDWVEAIGQAGRRVALAYRHTLIRDSTYTGSAGRRLKADHRPTRSL